MGFKSDLTKIKKVGGFAFYLSIIALFIVFFSNLIALPYLWDSYAKLQILRALLGFGVGICIALLIGEGHIAVLMHETKHAVLSSLVGNKFKSLKIGRRSGEYQYKYSKETEHYNAMIALAPYWFPLLTLPSFLFSFTEFGTEHFMRVLIGAAFGIDLTTALQDLGPHQSDLKKIRGGIKVATFYIVLAQLCTITIFAAWTMQGSYGVRYLVFSMWELIATFILR